MGVLLSPWLGVTVLASVIAFYASARGLQTGEAVPVIAATSVAANVSNIAGGILVFGDPLPGDALGLVIQGLAFAMVVVAAAARAAAGARRLRERLSAPAVTTPSAARPGLRGRHSSFAGRTGRKRRRRPAVESVPWMSLPSGTIPAAPGPSGRIRRTRRPPRAGACGPAASSRPSRRRPTTRSRTPGARARRAPPRGPRPRPADLPERPASAGPAGRAGRRASGSCGARTPTGLDRSRGRGPR